MRELTIGKNDAGQRLDRFVAKNLPLLPPALLQKYIRLKRVKVNGKGAKRDTRLDAGDVLRLYINDEFFDKPKEENLFLSIFQPRLSIVYEDENLLLADKRPGLVVHADETEKVNTLVNHIQAYLYQKREWSPRDEHAFAPTGTPGALSSPPKTRRPCGSSMRRYGPTSWKSPTSASPRAAPGRRRGKSRAFC